jgi:hypothetical protein
MEQLYKNPKDNINLYGYLQDDFSLELLSKNKETVKKWFTFKEEIDKSYEQLINNFKPYIAMHIRRGDLVTRKADMVATEEYLKVLDEIRNGRNLFIATDDRTLVSELNYLQPINIKNPIKEISPPIFDFWMLKNAQTVIGGGSTFSWWAAYLGSGDYYSPPLMHRWEDLGKKFQKWHL